MKSFFVRILNTLLIIGGILAYNSVLEQRALSEENARLQAELESANLRLEQKAQKAETASAEAGAYTDGVYEGTAAGFGGDITVKVTVEQGEISDLEIVSAEQEDKAYLGIASGIVDDILAKQSADVDTISGATFSSTGIRDAAAEALKEARGEK